MWERFSIVCSGSSRGRMVAIGVKFLNPGTAFASVTTEDLFPGRATITCPAVPTYFSTLGRGRVRLTMIPLRGTLRNSIGVALSCLVRRISFPVVNRLATPVHRRFVIRPSRIGR